MEQEATPATTGYDALIEVIRRRRSVRRFEKGRSVPRETLLRIAEAARWAPTGANAQCWDLLIVDDAATRARVLDVFLRQSQRLVDHAKGFPAVKKSYLANTVAIFVVLGDPRWKACFPQADADAAASWRAEYVANNERIYLASIGAVIQNVQLAVAACGLTSAWLSGGAETTTNADLRAALGYPDYLEAVGTIPVGFPEKDAAARYRRPLEQLVHWNAWHAEQERPQAMVDYFIRRLRPFAMYRHRESMLDWENADEKLGAWKQAFTGPHPGADG